MESPSDPMVADIRSHENPRYDASNRATTKSSMVSMGRVLPCSITLEELVGNPQRGGGTRNLHSVRPTTYAQPMPSLPNSDPETRRQTQRTRQGGQKAMHAFPQRGMEPTIPASCSYFAHRPYISLLQHDKPSLRSRPSTSSCSSAGPQPELLTSNGASSKHRSFQR